MPELGFDVPTERQSVHARQLTKEVLLVLELDGPARQKLLERARQHLAKEEALLSANPDKKEFENRVKWAKVGLENEENENSRLLAVDAGHDREKLRALYPERARYSIVCGMVQPRIVKNNNQERLAGFISGLMVDRVNVSLEFQPALGSSIQQRDRKEAPQSTYEFNVAFGKKLEPWIMSGGSPK